jgi:hypothetical protein
MLTGFSYSFVFKVVKLKPGNLLDLQELEATVVDGNGTETGHIIATTIGGRNGQPKQVCFHCMLCFIVSQLKETVWAKVNFE